MNRRELIKRLALLTGGLIMSNITSVAGILNGLPEQESLMPVLFMGHGNPMNAIEDNYFTKGWKTMVKGMPKPKAIVCISAHWETKGTKVTAMQNPKMIYDMYGFPKSLYEVNYPAQGNPALAKEIIEQVDFTDIHEDQSWGFDHGTWSVLTHAFPDADIPCIQLSLDKTRDLNYHYNLAKELIPFRKKGVLFVSSGNIVHNIRVIMQTNNKPSDWALDFDNKVTQFINDTNHSPLINYKTIGQSAEISVNSAEHYIPMLYALAMQSKKDNVAYFNHEDKTNLMGIGMRSFKIG